MTSWRSVGCQPRRCRTQPVRGMQGHRLSWCPPPAPRRSQLENRSQGAAAACCWGSEAFPLGYLQRAAEEQAAQELCLSKQQMASGGQKPAGGIWFVLEKPRSTQMREESSSRGRQLQPRTSEQSNNFGTDQGAALRCHQHPATTPRADLLHGIFPPWPFARTNPAGARAR